MTFLGGIADRIVLLGGTLAGGCVPGFVAQYRERVGGRLDQVLADMLKTFAQSYRAHLGAAGYYRRFATQIGLDRSKQNAVARIEAKLRSVSSW